MSVVKRIFLGSIVVAALLVAVGFLLPREAEVERSAVIDAPAPTVFALVNGFQSFSKWWPWDSPVSDAEYMVEGPEFGVGARLSWAGGNPQIGNGYQEIVASDPYSRVESRLELGAARTAVVLYEVESGDESTLVRWKVSTDFGGNPVRRYLGLMFERWIGADFEAGLANLTALAESLPTADWSDLDIELIVVESQPLAYTSSVSEWEVEEIGEAFGAAHSQVVRFMATHGLEQVGPPVAITTGLSDEEWQFDAGIPIAAFPELELDADSPVQIRETWEGRVARAISVGPYASLSSDWEKVRAWLAAHGFDEAGLPWEEYVSAPGETAEEELITHLYMPIS